MLTPPEIITFTVQHVPVAQPRVKTASRGGHAMVYTPTTVKTETGTKPHPIVEFKHALREAARAAMAGRPPIAGAVSVSWLALFPRTKGLTWAKKPMPRCPHIVKPDRDNMDKAILDGMKGIVIADDKAVCSGSLTKSYCAGGEAYGVQVWVKAIADAPVVPRQKVLQGVGT